MRFSKSRIWLGLVLLVPVLLVLTGLFAIPLYPDVDFEIDLKPQLREPALKLFTNQTVRAHLEFARASGGGFRITARGRALDWPYTLRLQVDYSLFRLRSEGAFDFGLDGSAWKLNGRFAASPRTYRAHVEMPPTTLNERDPVLNDILTRLPLPAISNLVFAGTLQFAADAEKTRELPVPVWTAKGRLDGLSASCIANDKAIGLKNLRTNFGAEGIADRMTIRPIYLGIESVEVGDLQFTKLSANVRKTESGYLITEAGTRFCGGEVKLYSLYLNPETLTAGFTLFLDHLDTNELMNRIPGFAGRASGYLHGKLPLFLKDGKKLKLRDAYLYSTPGETGELKLENPSPIVDNLRMGGVDEATCTNLSKALRNLAYTVLKLKLTRDANDALALTFHVDGSASDRGLTVPVSFQVTFHGDLEELINTGLQIGTKK